MSEPEGRLVVSRCDACHARFVPRLGPCPRCGSMTIFPHSVPDQGVVLAATELSSPSAGWPSPHRLVLVELPESVRVLAIAVGELPAHGAAVRIVRDESKYLAEPLIPLE